jgi:hypothetical protein
MAMIIKEAEFLKREGLSSQILLHAVLLLLFLFAHTFQQDLKSCQSYREQIFASAKIQRFVLGISQDFRRLQRKCVNWGCP